MKITSNIAASLAITLIAILYSGDASTTLVICSCVVQLLIYTTADLHPHFKKIVISKTTTAARAAKIIRVMHSARTIASRSISHKDMRVRHAVHIRHSRS